MGVGVERLLYRPKQSSSCSIAAFAVRVRAKTVQSGVAYRFLRRS